MENKKHDPKTFFNSDVNTYYYVLCGKFYGCSIFLFFFVCVLFCVFLHGTDTVRPASCIGVVVQAPHDRRPRPMSCHGCCKWVYKTMRLPAAAALSQCVFERGSARFIILIIPGTRYYCITPVLRNK